MQAGILEERYGDSDVPAAILSDAHLQERQKQVLLELYEAYRRENDATVAAAETLSDGRSRRHRWRPRSPARPTPAKPSRTRTARRASAHPSSRSRCPDESGQPRRSLAAGGDRQRRTVHSAPPSSPCVATRGTSPRSQEVRMPTVPTITTLPGFDPKPLYALAGAGDLASSGYAPGSPRSRPRSRSCRRQVKVSCASRPRSCRRRAAVAADRAAQAGRGADPQAGRGAAVARPVAADRAAQAGRGLAASRPRSSPPRPQARTTSSRSAARRSLPACAARSRASRSAPTPAQDRRSRRPRSRRPRGRPPRRLRPSATSAKKTTARKATSAKTDRSRRKTTATKRTVAKATTTSSSRAGRRSLG